MLVDTYDFKDSKGYSLEKVNKVNDVSDDDSLPSLSTAIELWSNPNTIKKLYDDSKSGINFICIERQLICELEHEDNQAKFKDGSESVKEQLSEPMFGHLQPKEIERTSLFPEFPKSDEEGFAIIIELEESVACQLATNRSMTLELLKTMQYSRSNQGGGGIKSKKHVKFLSTSSFDDLNLDNEGPLMEYHSRQCGGTKACEYFKVINHTEVDIDGPYWASHLAEQERFAANTNLAQVLTIYQEYENLCCDRPILGATKRCDGKAVIRSRKIDSAIGKVHCMLFIGCERWQPRESGHTYISLNNYDPTWILRTWGRDRCYVHTEILEALEFDWNTSGIVFKIHTD